MKLMTAKLEKRFAEVGSQDEAEDPVVVATFFNPAGWEIWYATEYDPKTKTFFGYVTGFDDWTDHWGYFSLAELEVCGSRYGISIKRDLDWPEKKQAQSFVKETHGSKSPFLAWAVNYGFYGLDPF